MPEHNKKNYNLLKSMGICTGCGKEKAVEGKVMCKACQEEKTAEQRARREQAKKFGVCPRCFKNKLYVGETCCPECYEKRRKNAAAYKEKNLKNQRKYHAKKVEELSDKGLCRYCWTRPATPGMSSCLRCRERRKKYTKKDGIDKFERGLYGLCYICGEPVIEGKKLCKEHYDLAVSHLPKKTDNTNHVWGKDEHIRYEQWKRRSQG